MIEARALANGTLLDELSVGDEIVAGRYILWDFERWLIISALTWTHWQMAINGRDFFISKFGNTEMCS